MSFGLLNELASLVGGPERVPQMSFDAVMSRTVLHLVLAPRNKRGVIIREDEEDTDPIIPWDLSPEGAEAILDWAATHTLDFFIRQFAKHSQLFAARAEDLAAVGSSLSSSVTSPSKTA